MKKSYKFLFTLVCICYHLGHCFAHNFPRERFARENYIDSIIDTQPFHLDDSAAVISALSEYYSASSDGEYLPLIDLLQQYYGAVKTELPNPIHIAAIEKIAGIYSKTYPNTAARALHILGTLHMNIIQNYEKAFDYYLRLEDLINAHGYKTITATPLYISNISKAYYKFRDYPKVINLMHTLLKTPREINAIYYYGHWAAYNNLGLCYRDLGNIDSSTHYFKLASTHPDILLHDLTQSIAMGNLGYNYYLSGRYEDAMPMLKRDMQVALKLKYTDYGLAAGAAIPLADIYVKQGKLQAADSLLTASRSWITLCGQYDRLKRYFPVVAAYYRAKKDYARSNDYKDSLIAAMHYNDSVFNSLSLMRVRQRKDLESLENEQQKFITYKEKFNAILIGVAIVLLFAITIIIVVVRFRRKIARNKQHIEELQQIIDLRQRISADIHDDIGSTLSSISVYTHSLLLQPQQDKQKSILEKIRTNAQSAQENISDIIWSVNPDMDMIEDLLARMRNFGADLTENAGIRFRFEEGAQIKTLALDMICKKNLYLIYKEAINNAVKYSNAKEITICIELTAEQMLHLSVTDDGSGFDVRAGSAGNGLKNMQRRAMEMNGVFQIKSTPLNGTKMDIFLPLPAMA